MDIWHSFELQWKICDNELYDDHKLQSKVMIMIQEHAMSIYIVGDLLAVKASELWLEMPNTSCTGFLVILPQMIWYEEVSPSDLEHLNHEPNMNLASNMKPFPMNACHLTWNSDQWQECLSLHFIESLGWIWMILWRVFIGCRDTMIWVLSRWASRI